MSLNEQREALKIISELLEDPYNQICADCQCQPSKWASTTLGVFICIDCSGVHRSLGTHISFVRSCTLDTWVMDQARLMKAIGNRLGNSYWESKLPKDFQRPGNSNRSLMQAFIKDKYQIKKWADAGPPPHIVYKHLLTKKLSLTNQMGGTPSKKSKRSRHHTSHRSSRRNEKSQNTALQMEPPKPQPQITTQVTTPPDDLNMPLDDFFAEQPRRTIPKPYIPHKKVVYEKPKEEPDYENMNSDEIDKFFQNNGNDEYTNADGQNNDENGNGRNRSDSLEKAMMQRIQNILDEEKPKKSLNKNKSQIEYDENYDDEEEEEDDIFGDSAVAVTYPFGQHVSRSDPQISNAAQGYETFDDNPVPNITSLQSFFDKTSKPKNNENESASNLVANNASFSNSNVTTYSNLNISSNSKPIQINSDDDNDDDDNHRHQAVKSKQQRSVVLSKSKLEPNQEKEKEKDLKEIESQENQNENNLISLNEQQNENNESNDISIDKINLDIGSEYTGIGGDGNADAGFWDDDAADNNNNLDDGFFELPPNSNLNNIKLEGKAILQTPSLISENKTTTDTIDSQFNENKQEDVETKKSQEPHFTLGISGDFESFGDQQTDNSISIQNTEENKNENDLNDLNPIQINQTEANDAIIDYNPFESDKQANFNDNPLNHFIENQNNNEQIFSQEQNQDLTNNENENTEVAHQADIDLDALAEAIGEEEADEKTVKNNENTNFVLEEEEEESSETQQNDQQLNQNTDSQSLDKDNQNQVETDNENNQKPEIETDNSNEQKTENETEIKIDQNSEATETKENNQNSISHNESTQKSEKETENLQKQELRVENNQSNQPPAYSSRPLKLSISMVNAMDLAPPGVTPEDEMIDDFFAEAEASITPSRTTTQNQNHRSRSRHHRRQHSFDYDDDYDNATDVKNEKNSDYKDTKSKRQIPPDVSVSRTQKSAFAPPPARKPGAHIPARLQKKMEPSPSEKDTTRRRRHHHRKPE